jgi:hypothetical protein
MHLREVVCEDVDWIEEAQDRSCWLDFINTVINFLVS